MHIHIKHGILNKIILQFWKNEDMPYHKSQANFFSHKSQADYVL